MKLLPKTRNKFHSTKMHITNHLNNCKELCTINFLCNYLNTIQSSLFEVKNFPYCRDSFQLNKLEMIIRLIVIFQINEVNHQIIYPITIL